ncbi:MAG: hypothetical protein H6574_17615 [Lewinellaceae bacterium]|nr:hypothetical protein [Lewinellaceae bacterium]
MTGTLTPTLVLIVLFLYFAMLVGVALITGRNVSNEGFFLANRKVPWYVVAYAMIGTSISGVTFISVPGAVGLESGLNRGFGYMQVVLGYLLGYLFIATVLMPMYYRLNLTSIYGYLERRLGYWSYKTGAGFFILSRTFGSGYPDVFGGACLTNLCFSTPGRALCAHTVTLMMGLIYAYTFKGGLKTIIWTDTIMTTFFIAAVIFTVITVGKAMHLDVGHLWGLCATAGTARFSFDNFFSDPNHFVKQFVSGALIAIVMTGLDQDLMQKNWRAKTSGKRKRTCSSFAST